jgi:hypothetical protein
MNRTGTRPCALNVIKFGELLLLYYKGQTMTFNFFSPGIVIFAMVVFWAITVIIHISFALAVGSDATKLRNSSRDLIFVGPGIWFLATLLGGVFVAAAYWIIHHSRLNEAIPPSRNSAETDRM